MNKKLITLLLPCIFLILSATATAIRPHIFGPHIRIIDKNIIVNLSLQNISDLEAVINSGVGKEIIFTVELIRVWEFWPDEFVAAKKIRKIIKYDYLRDQYEASAYDGLNRTEKQFNNYYALRNWIFTEEGIRLANVRELEQDDYYVRVIVESKSLKQLPVIGMLMHLVPEIDMTIVKESTDFHIGDDQ
ncbi:MAG: DUF4390 domain-containing protein [Nitrospiraceae bacterium]|nr:MAG: DUF4390 domain-containing protein [Nitrospiraceae bacterium]